MRASHGSELKPPPQSPAVPPVTSGGLGRGSAPAREYHGRHARADAAVQLGENHP